jgi:type VI protein secretion system component VasK
MKFVNDARLWWRRWSTWLAAFAGAVAAAMVAAPGLLVGLVGFFPGEWRPFLAGAVFVLVFIVPVLVTHLKQPKLEKLRDGQAAD